MRPDGGPVFLDGVPPLFRCHPKGGVAPRGLPDESVGSVVQAGLSESKVYRTLGMEGGRGGAIDGGKKARSSLARPRVEVSRRQRRKFGRRQVAAGPPATASPSRQVH